MMVAVFEQLWQNIFKLDYLPSQKFYFCPGGGFKCKKGNYFLTIFLEFS